MFGSILVIVVLQVSNISYEGHAKRVSTFKEVNLCLTKEFITKIKKAILSDSPFMK